MRRFLLFTTPIVLIFSSWLFYKKVIINYPEEIKTFVLKNTHEIKSINPKNLEFQDLEEVGKAIGNAKVVFLGEQDHGDASTFLAKTRLIKFLHQNKNFDVLVFESDFYGLNKRWELIEQGKTPIGEYRKDIYNLWTNCDACSDLFHYIDSSFSSNNKLIVAGNDPRHILDYSRTNYIEDFKKVSTKYELFENTKEEAEFLGILSDLLHKEYESKINQEQQEIFTSKISNIQDQLPMDNFWNQEMENLKRFALSCWDTLQADNFRDLQMGDNLLWLIHEKYKGKKVIVWAHNFHIAKNFGQLENLQFLKKGDSINMGTFVYENFKKKEDLYFIGFNSYSGEAGDLSNEKFKIAEPLPNFFESWVNESDYEFAFLNFKNIPTSYRNEQYKFLMKGIFHSPIKTNWSNVYDGIFYIKKMEACNFTNKDD